MKAVFSEIIQIDLKDGFTFQEMKISELIHPHMGYQGAEVAITAYFGRTRFKVAIDLGFGDIIEVIEQPISLISYSKGSLFEKSVDLPCYPKEFIFAEKLETVIYRGHLNSRMKDFHDLYSLIASSQSFPFQKLDQILQTVFEHRQTPFDLPITYTESAIVQLQNLWNSYLNTLKNQNLPQSFSQLIEEINVWLQENTVLELA